MTLEHFGWISPDENPNYKSTSWNEREDDYSSVAFWYQTGQPTFTERAPHARERTLPSLERSTLFAREFTDQKFHGASNATTTDRSLSDRPTALHAQTGRRGVAGDSV